MQLSNSICFQCPGYDIPRKFRCDGLNNCGDNSDEENCPPGHQDDVSVFIKETDHQSIRWILDSIAAKENGEPLPPAPTQEATDLGVKAGLIGQEPVPDQDNVIMLTSGFGGFGVRKNGKVATFLDPNSGTSIICNTGDFPDGVQEATGNLVDGMPVLCGGIGGERAVQYDKSANCYILRDGVWNQFTKMSEKRKTAASGTVTRDGKEALFVTGGYDNNNYLKTTEFVFSNGDVIPGPDLPEARNGHCMAQLDENRFLIMGGNMGTSGRKTNTTLIYDSTTDEYTDGPSMEYARNAFACTVFWSDLHYSPVVIAAGGSGKNAKGTSAGNRAELWTLDERRKSSGFEKTKNLPQLMTSGPNLLPNTKGGAILTFDKKVYVLTCTTVDGCKWDRKMEHDMDIARRYHVGISIPANTHVKC